MAQALAQLPLQHPGSSDIGGQAPESPVAPLPAKAGHSKTELRFVDTGVPALLLVGQVWCLVHPLYRLSLLSLLPLVANVHLLLMTPKTLPQSHPLPLWPQKQRFL